MRRRKRTNSNVPAKGRLRDMADRLWSLAVRSDWGHKCAVCSAKKCEAHHLVPRQFESTRYDLRNGIALCASCHKFNRNISPHQNAAGWMAWLYAHHLERAAWYRVNLQPIFKGTKNADHYCDVIQRLRQYVEPDDFERIVGVNFSRYLLDRHER